MLENKKVYSYGVWKVKNGQQEKFISLYKEFAEFAQKNHGLIEAGLLSDFSNSKNFISYGLWPNIELIQNWKNHSEFKKYMSLFKTICEHIKIEILEKLLYINP